MRKITFLGTSSMLPTKERNPSSILISLENETIMIDCGEGTQRQLRIAGISPCKITKLLITHWHGDHILGLPGLIQSLGANQYSGQLDIYGPKGTLEFFTNMRKSFYFPVRINLKLHEVSSGVFFRDKNMEISCIPLEHDVPCLGYSIKEQDKRKINIEYTKKFGLVQHPLMGDLQKGKDIVYKGKKILANKATKLKKGCKITVVLDTAYNKKISEFSKDSSILICEATWADELSGRSEDYKHLVASDAARIAKEAKAQKLILTHFSQRYKDVSKLKEQARKIFRNTSCAQDLEEIEF